MPAFTEMREYRFTDTQINLIVYALERLRGTMSDLEEREAEDPRSGLEGTVKRMDSDTPVLTLTLTTTIPPTTLAITNDY